jgi:tRNA-Thr(GGU) m(6)t(6)A37 methyltransferase TsaA
MNIDPIGYMSCPETYPYDVPRQGRFAQDNLGTIVLESGHNFEQALEDLEGFDRIWVIFEFHHNKNWKPKVYPPRYSDKKVGVFATRAPYRPCAIGLSCVQLVSIRGLKIEIANHDLLNGTPILDIKPYIVDADCFPDAKCGWLDKTSNLAIYYSKDAQAQVNWLEENGVSLRKFIKTQLEYNPSDENKKRLIKTDLGISLAYRTWRINFEEKTEQNRVLIREIQSGYQPKELAQGSDDPYGDKDIHRAFLQYFHRG